MKRRSAHQIVGVGAGLDLALSHGIIERHGGRIRVESEPGHGVTFVIELSLYARPDDFSVRRE